MKSFHSFHRDFFFIVLLIPLVLLNLSCAGKPINTKYKKIRYIPEEKRYMYIGTIYNHTPFKRLGRQLRNSLSTHFLNSPEVIFNTALKSSDLFLETEIVDFLIDVLSPSTIKGNIEMRHLIRVRISIKDVKTTKAYINNVNIQVSHLQKIKDGEKMGNEDEVKRKLFGKIAKNIEHLIHTGNVLINSQFGYEGLEEREGTWLEKNKDLFGIKENTNLYGSLNEDQTKISESNRIEKINQLDQKGFQRY